MTTDVNRKTSGTGFVDAPTKGDTWVVVRIRRRTPNDETDFFRSTNKGRAVEVLASCRKRYPELRWRLDRLIRSKDVEHDPVHRVAD